MAQSSTVVLERTKTITRKKYRVIMHNDDTTSFDCVIRILQEVFMKTFDEANNIALAIHKAGPNGQKVVGEYSKSIADAKASKGMRIAKMEGFPNFKITVK